MTALIVVIVGGSVLLLVQREQRSDLDRDLRRLADALDRPIADRSDVTSLLAGSTGLPEGVVVHLRGPDGETLVGLGTVDALPPPSDRGVALVGRSDADGGPLRVLTRAADDVGQGAVVQVGLPVGPIDDAVAGLRRRYIRSAVLGVVAAGLGGWILAGRALAPLARLRRQTASLAATGDVDQRVTDRSGVAEVDALGRRLNDLLARLEQAIDERESAAAAARGFAADAAHQLRTPLAALTTDVEVLGRPGLRPDEAATVREAVEADIARLTRVLTALHQLALGELTPSTTRSPVDLVDVVEASIASARRRHPHASFSVEGPDGTPSVQGWPDGLAIMVDNLIDNAALHGTEPDGRARVSVTVRSDDGEAVTMTVTDHGPGIPEDERDAVRARFVRGREATRDGTGLGLTLVDQQVALHRGLLTVEQSPGAGCRISVRLPTD